MSLDKDLVAPCEEHGADLSALMDGELAASQVLEAVDHLSTCVACRRFYRRARALDELVESEALPGDAEPPLEIWQRIESASRASWSKEESSPWLAWAPRLAALFLLAAGLWALAPMREGPRLAATEDLEIRLGEDGGRMTEARFLEIATELLRADHRYHREMLQVMSAVAESGRKEGSDEGARNPPEGRRVSLGEGDFERGGEGRGWNGFRL